MRVVCVFRDNQDYSRSVTEWLENFRRQTGKELETLDPDENPSFCETYDIVEYPTIIALDNQGSVVALWRGRELPLINSVSYYASWFKHKYDIIHLWVIKNRVVRLIKQPKNQSTINCHEFFQIKNAKPIYACFAVLSLPPSLLLLF